MNKCGLRKIIQVLIADYALATSECCCCYCCVCVLYQVCPTAVMRRLTIDAIGVLCAVRAWGLLCGVRVSPQSPEHDSF